MYSLAILMFNPPFFCLSEQQPEGYVNQLLPSTAAEEYNIYSIRINRNFLLPASDLRPIPILPCIFP
jgi:hypothetical protein